MEELAIKPINHRKDAARYFLITGVLITLPSLFLSFFQVTMHELGSPPPIGYIYVHLGLLFVLSSFLYKTRFKFLYCLGQLPVLIGLSLIVVNVLNVEANTVALIAFWFTVQFIPSIIIVLLGFIGLKSLRQQMPPEIPESTSNHRSYKKILRYAALGFLLLLWSLIAYLNILNPMNLWKWHQWSPQFVFDLIPPPPNL